MSDTVKQKKTPDVAPLRYNYLTLAILSLAYIFLMYTAAFFRSPYLSLSIQVVAVAVPLLLARFVPFLRVAVTDSEIGISPRPLLTTLWLLIPFVGCVFALSYVTGKIAGLVGVDTSYSFGSNVWVTILSSAVIPAVCEELFCRYVFLPRLSPFSRSGAIFASALFFSLLHGNLYQIPYALAAGVFLGALAVGCGSILPGILFHFANNLVSILLHFYAHTALPTVFLWILVGGVTVGVICAVLMRRRLWERLRLAFHCDRMTGSVVLGLVTTPIVFFLVVFLINAIAGGFFS